MHENNEIRRNVDGKNLVICDPEKEFAKKMALYIKDKKGLPFQIHICSEIRQVMEFQKEQTIALFLVSDEIPKEDYETVAANVKILLETAKGSKENGEGVFKYQRAEQLYQKIVQIYLEAEKEKKEIQPFTGGGGELIAFYSPTHPISQTMLAVNMGKQLAKKQNVLYLNLETYAGIEELFPQEERNLAMLLYYVKQEVENLHLLLPTIVKQMGDLDYIPPFLLPNEMMEITKEEWKQLFSWLRRTSIYEVIVLDIGEWIPGLYDILMECSTIYLCTDEEQRSPAKVGQFEKILYQLGYGEVWERTVFIDGNGRTV